MRIHLAYPYSSDVSLRYDETCHGWLLPLIFQWGHQELYPSKLTTTDFVPTVLHVSLWLYHELLLLMLLFLGLPSFSFLHFFGEMDFFSILLDIVLLKLRTIFPIMFIAMNLSYVHFFQQSVWILSFGSPTLLPSSCLLA